MMAEVSDIRAPTTSTAWRPLLTVLFATGLASCGGPPESAEQQLRTWVDRGHEAAELKDRGASIDDIEIFDESAAQVRLTVAMAATTDSALGFNADAYEFELDLEQADSEWLLVSGRWNDVRNELR
jgi:hypothetical protein